MEVVCLFWVLLLLVDASSVLESSSLKFLGLRWTPAPFQHRSAGCFVCYKSGTLDTPFWYSGRRCGFVLLSFLVCDNRPLCDLVICNSCKYSRVNTRGKEACTRSCCFRGRRHCWHWNVVTLLKSVQF